MPAMAGHGVTSHDARPQKKIVQLKVAAKALDLPYIRRFVLAHCTHSLRTSHCTMHDVKNLLSSANVHACAHTHGNACMHAYMHTCMRACKDMLACVSN